MTTSSRSITQDPIYFTTAAFFAVLTTALPALLGQPRFMPILQALSLTIFMVLPLHHRHPGGALRVVAIWLPLQYLTLVLLTLIFRGQVEQAITNGFVLQGEIAQWYFGGAAMPAAFGATLGGRLIELIGVVVGSLASAGLVGAWFIAGTLNLAAYTTAIVAVALESALLFPFAIPWWTLLRVAGLAGLLVLLAEPLITYTWSPRHYWQHRRALILGSAALFIVGVLVELFLPGLLAHTPSA